MTTGQLRVICVAGARPNYMKIKPVMDALEQNGAEVILVHTGQHYDTSMSDIFFAELGIRRPDYFLRAGSGSHAVQTGRVMTAFEPLAGQLRPDVVVVVGDVNSTVACALVTAKCGALLAHVEAGLRSRDWSMPEEVNRVVTDRLSDYLFAPSADAVVNLEAEGYRDDQIYLAGNVMVDTLLANLDRAARGDTLRRLGLEPREYGLVTLHRPANVDDPAVLATLLPALEAVARLCPLVLPAHPRTAGLRDAGVCGLVNVIPPVGYLDFLALQASARLVLTDSGGVQEETTALGIPCLTLRDNTERPVTLTEGTNRLVGRDPGRIIAAARQVLRSPPAARRPALWDGRAGQRIAAALLTDGARQRLRPTAIRRKPGARSAATPVPSRWQVIQLPARMSASVQETAGSGSTHGREQHQPGKRALRRSALGNRAGVPDDLNRDPIAARHVGMRLPGREQTIKKSQCCHERPVCDPGDWRSRSQRRGGITVVRIVLIIEIDQGKIVVGHATHGPNSLLRLWAHQNLGYYRAASDKGRGE